MPPRKQCAKCPWRTTTNPWDIPGGYSTDLHRALTGTIAKAPAGIEDLAAATMQTDLRIMACHETTKRNELPCVGWLVHQLGPGNNIALRIAVMTGRVDGNVKTVGPQHQRFEDTMPKKREG